jgi:hypothetical protein
MRAAKRKLDLTSVSRSKRAHIESKCQIDYLTPKSKRKRIEDKFKGELDITTKTYKVAKTN